MRCWGAPFVFVGRNVTARGFAEWGKQAKEENHV
jgi:hypothetical protein